MQVLQPVKHVNRDEPSYNLKKVHWVNPQAVRKDHDLKKIVRFTSLVFTYPSQQESHLSDLGIFLILNDTSNLTNHKSIVFSLFAITVDRMMLHVRVDPST